MKKKGYLRSAVFMLALGLAALSYGLSLAGFFNRYKIMVKELPCSRCANYKVSFGSFKLSNQVQDTGNNINTSQVYINGVANPYIADYNKTYNYYLVTARVTGLQAGESG